MAITAAVALAFAAVAWLDRHGQVHNVRTIPPIDDHEWACSCIDPTHGRMTPVVFGGIGVGVWLLVYLYSPRRLDWVLFAIMAAVVLG